LLGAGLLLVAGLALAAAVALWRRSPAGPGLVAAALVLFLADGALDGWVLFGRPGNRGTAGSAIAAAVIGALVWLGREHPGPGRPDHDRAPGRGAVPGPPGSPHGD
jgi:hypothetical protein